ncbi:hypothetical protein PUNSTDRAFT_137424 [Punctularia strigosozonata HHB-11173 SS5]|uniref:uncharacterized protein n=1 Tax=Punctularia strigosozonata (strain HHB-11173) TaxID=741275 RepID=UPI0004416474|nr:uncharacterized protein PUNSTDRAFT_137424 [Punctularia strigosozonata HHB-11173 SS5]EIN05940.1 hypothetical protein PUNSTDRAFT_137424 [Punctularia strigosozonata HHB-11173 SS5]
MNTRRSQSHPNFAQDAGDPVLPHLLRTPTRASADPLRPDEPVPGSTHIGPTPTDIATEAVPEPDPIADVNVENESPPSAPLEGYLQARVVARRRWKLARNEGKNIPRIEIGSTLKLQDGIARRVTTGEVMRIVGVSRKFVVFEIDSPMVEYGHPDVPAPTEPVCQCIVPKEWATVPRWAKSMTGVMAMRLFHGMGRPAQWEGKMLDERYSKFEEDWHQDKSKTEDAKVRRCAT